MLQSTLDLLERGYDVHILADGVSSCNKEEVPWALERMRQAGAQITTSESMLFQLQGNAFFLGVMTMLVINRAPNSRRIGPQLQAIFQCNKGGKRGYYADAADATSHSSLTFVEYGVLRCTE